MSIKSAVPWWAKVGLKLGLARIPFRYQVWHKFGAFVHGAMSEPSYAYSVFEKHYQAVNPRPGFVSLEMGPGDSLFCALLSKAFGGSEIHLVDVGAFVTCDVERYKAMARYITGKGHMLPNIESANTVDEILALCSARYYTNGLASLRTLPSKSVDFIFSQAVLEHVRKYEFLDTMKETRRIVRDNGACSHQIDLRDHLEQALNSLRFSEKTWESPLFSSSGFYTNRFRFNQLQHLFSQASFSVEVRNAKRWETLPTPKGKMNPQFISLSDEELKVASFGVLLKPVCEVTSKASSAA